MKTVILLSSAIITRAIDPTMELSNEIREILVVVFVFSAVTDVLNFCFNASAWWNK